MNVTQVEVVSWLAAIFGSGIVSSIVTTLVSNWLQRRDRLADRQRTLDDSWRTDLRHAHAQFIASYSRLLSIGKELYVLVKITRDQRLAAADAALAAGASNEEATAAFSRDVSTELAEKTRKTYEDYTAAEIEVGTRLVEVLLLEIHPPIQALLITILESPLVKPERTHDLDRFLADISERRKLLDELTRGIKGMFSPEQWNQRAPPQSGRLVGIRGAAQLPSSAGQSKPKTE